MDGKSAIYTFNSQKAHSHVYSHWCILASSPFVPAYLHRPYLVRVSPGCPQLRCCRVATTRTTIEPVEEGSDRSEGRGRRGRECGCSRTHDIPIDSWGTTAAATTPTRQWSTDSSTARGGPCVGYRRGCILIYACEIVCGIQIQKIAGPPLRCSIVHFLSLFPSRLACHSLSYLTMDPLSPSKINPSWSNAPTTPSRTVTPSAQSPLPTSPLPASASSSSFREPKVFGAPGLGLVNPPSESSQASQAVDVNKTMSTAKTQERQGSYLRVRIGGLERNRKDLLIRFDASVSSSQLDLPHKYRDTTWRKTMDTWMALTRL